MAAKKDQVFQKIHGELASCIQKISCLNTILLSSLLKCIIVMSNLIIKMARFSTA